MSFLSRKSGSFLGVDIGSSAVKCVELVGSANSPKVKAWGVEPIEAGTIEEGAIVQQDSVIASLDSLLNRCRIKTKNVAVAISSSHAITKVIAMPIDMTESDIEDQVEMEASHFVPYAIEDVNLDFQALGPSKSNPDNEQDVLIAACRTDIVDDYVSVIQEVGLQPTVVDIDTFALQRLFSNQRVPNISGKNSQAVAAFDVGVNSTKVVVFEGDEIIFSRQQKFGGSQLINLVRQEYGLGVSEALSILESESPPSDIVENVYQPFMSMAANEFNRALQFFYSSSKHEDVSQLLFTGGVSGLPRFSEAMGQAMNVAAQDLVDFSQFSVQGNRGALVSKMGRLSVATGLALRGLDS
ncbi:MAG: type IV pilus assembly protein PilM [Arenicella sp.]